MLSKITLILFLTLSFISCSKKEDLSTPLINENKQTAPPWTWQKNPPQIPTVPPTNLPGGTTEPAKLDPLVVRSVVKEFTLSQSFSNALNAMNYYDSDNCIQWIKMTKGSQLIGDFLEISNVSCPGSHPIEDNFVLVRLTIKQDPKYFTQFHVIYEQSASPEIGMIRKLSIDSVVSYQLEGLCDADPNGWDRSWDTYCTLQIENSLWANPPLDMMNLD